MRIIILRQNINWVNTLKGIGILAVVLGHINSPLSGFIFSWHMPLFFMIAGFFINFDLSANEFKMITMKEFKRFFIPYFIFSLMAVSVEIGKRHLLQREKLDLLKAIQGILFNMDMPSLHEHYGFVLWFLPALFFGKLIVRILVLLSTNHLASVFMGVLAFFYMSFNVSIPFAIDESLNIVVWVFIGFLFFCSKQLLIGWKTLAIAIGFIFLFKMPGLNIAEKFYSDPLLNLVWAMSVVFVLIFLSQMIASSRFNVRMIFEILGNASFLIFVLHPYTNNIADLIIERIQPDLWYAKLIVSLAGLTPFIYLKHRYNNSGVFKYV